MKNKEFYDLMNLEYCLWPDDSGEVSLEVSYNKEKLFDEYDRYDYVIGKFIDWLESEYKEPIKLSDDEKVILRNIDKRYKWIARDKYYNLGIYDVKPYKNESVGFWKNNNNIFDGRYFNAYNHLFQFIKWSNDEPYSIEELLKDD